MEPGKAAPGHSPEVGNAHAPEAFKVPETSSEQPKSHEKAPSGGETREVVNQPGGGPGPQQVAQKPAHALPTLPVPQITADPTKGLTKDDNPLVAADEDLVEKEWVDKAKKIVAGTRDDPYSQEKEVSKLQADYLKKRYGKEVKLSSD